MDNNICIHEVLHYSDLLFSTQRNLCQSPELTIPLSLFALAFLPFLFYHICFLKMCII